MLPLFRAASAFLLRAFSTATLPVDACEPASGCVVNSMPMATGDVFCESDILGGQRERERAWAAEKSIVERKASEARERCHRGKGAPQRSTWNVTHPQATRRHPTRRMLPHYRGTTGQSNHASLSSAATCPGCPCNYNCCAAAAAAANWRTRKRSVQYRTFP